MSYRLKYKMQAVSRLKSVKHNLNVFLKQFNGSFVSFISFSRIFEAWETQDTKESLFLNNPTIPPIPKVLESPRTFSRIEKIQIKCLKIV